MREIQLTKNKVAIIDDEDFELVSKWKWSFDGNYAVRGKYIGNVNGKDKYKKIYLHREINKTQDNLETDHINKNKLDNRRSNLRSVTKGINSNNHGAHKNNSTGICGVTWSKSAKKFNTRIFFQGKKYHLGYFTKIEDAILARELAEKKYGIRY
jgi:hypothetical protein